MLETDALNGSLKQRPSKALRATQSLVGEGSQNHEKIVMRYRKGGADRGAFELLCWLWLR